MAQVTATLGGHIPERGPQTVHTAPLPAVAAGQTQVLQLVTDFSGTPSVNLGGWRTLLSSNADANRNRLWTLCRNGPQDAATAQVTYGGAAATTVGVGYGVSGEAQSWAANIATQSSAATTIPPAPPVTTKVESLTTVAICSANFPRLFATPSGMTALLPSAESTPPQDWAWNALGGMGARVASIVTSTSLPMYQPPQWTATDPDNPGASPGDAWRIHAVNWAPAVVTPTMPTVSVDAISGYAPMPEMAASVVSSTDLQVGWNIRDMPENKGITAFEVYVTPVGSNRGSPKIAAGGTSGLVTFSGLTPGQAYVAAVRSVREPGIGITLTTYSALAEQTVTMPGAPRPPTDVSVSVTGSTTAIVSWVWAGGDSMEVWVSSATGGLARAGTVMAGTSTYQIQGLTAATDYLVQLRSLSGSQTSVYTTAIPFRTSGGSASPPSAPPPSGTPPPPDDDGISTRVRRNLRLMKHC